MSRYLYVAVGWAWTCDRGADQFLRFHYARPRSVRRKMMVCTSIAAAALPSRLGAPTMQDLIWIGVSVGFFALSLVYVALAGKA